MSKENKLREIGKVTATEKFPNTVDNFHFWTDWNVILKPFDVIVVLHIKESKTFAVVEEINHVTDTPSFLSSYVSSDFGDINVPSFTQRMGFNYIKASVTGNTKNIFNPVRDGEIVRLANAEEVIEAYGLNEIKNPICAGYFEMYGDIDDKDKVVVPVNLDRTDLIGPEAAHINISGISGLATKTSYATFLIKSLQDKYKKKEFDERISYIVFNVKGQDLLHLDELSEDKKFEQMKGIYKKLDIEPTPLDNVNYYYPYTKSNTKSNCNTFNDINTLEKQLKDNRGKKFAFTFEDSRDWIELFFSGVDDSTGTMESCLDAIAEDSLFSVADWNEFRKEIRAHAEKGNTKKSDITPSSWRKFSRIIGQSISDHIFQPNQKGCANLSDEIEQLQGNDIFVIDIANMTESIQSFIFGVVLQTVMKIKSENKKDSPDRMVIFMDELNKYASKEVPKRSPILQQILDVTERGRSLGVILFGAEQFKSAIHDRVIGNCVNNVYGRSNAVELSTRGYSYISKSIKSLITRLSPGELILQSPKFRQMMKINFPFPSYHQPKG